ncbi:ribonuclease H [Senna tora]|uniref:Ribonuclease H n=1 Tax=Senna tora TaxID=362788 RepID=A0A834SD71_9FABA|nr:ribonuclease H [Senna tora]
MCSVPLAGEPVWREDEDTNIMLKNLTPMILKWNKDNIGNLFRRKNRLISRIEGIQRTDDHVNNRFLCKLEKDLKKELDEVLKQEEIMWFQKSRGQWIQDGDKNTKLYHTKTIVRRRIKLTLSKMMRVNGLKTPSRLTI